MPQVIKSFPRHRLIRPTDRTDHFVRGGGGIVREVADTLVRVRETRYHRETPQKQYAASLKWIAKLARELTTPHPIFRVRVVVDWYEQNWTGAYVPWVEDGRELYQKFGRLESLMIDRLPREDPVRSVEDVLSQAFNGDRVTAGAFQSEILIPAGDLNFGGAHQADVTKHLVQLYRAILVARSGVGHVPGHADPIYLLRRYVEWLGERGWSTMTPRVLSVDSPAFQQFRRSEAALHPLGFDPLTGE